MEPCLILVLIEGSVLLALHLKVRQWLFLHTTWVTWSEVLGDDLNGNHGVHVNPVGSLQAFYMY